MGDNVGLAIFSIALTEVNLGLLGWGPSALVVRVHLDGKRLVAGDTHGLALLGMALSVEPLLIFLWDLTLSLGLSSIEIFAG